ncbi:MAG TPA: LON peptidase substrate-binding domain-containing protein [Rhodocyclaceae bacterium]|nr:LON peptidase substrate-binding domain-containing protein [Rhodocyclaceae bacterium]
MSEEIPLFPLNAVLFPGGLLPLRIFEQRYMDMVTACIKNNTQFGVCLIADGQEVGKPAVPHEIGTLAQINEGDWDMPQLGVLSIKARGTQRFRIQERRTEDSGLQLAKIELIENEPPMRLPSTMARMMRLMGVILADAGDAVPEPHLLDDAVWIGNRYAELLPISQLAKQKLMELDDTLLRVETIYRYLEQKELLRG